jgi:subtilase family serine protease
MNNITRLLLRLGCGLALLVLVARTDAADMQALHGCVPPVVSQLRSVGRLDESNRLNFVIGLPLRNPAELTDLLQQLYDPASTNFHRYLTPEQFNERFGPTEADYQAILKFAVTNGFTVTGTYASRGMVDVTASVPDIEKAFHVNMRLYQHPTEPREFYAPDVEPLVDTNLAILSISGLNNYVLPHPMVHIQSTPKAAGPANGSGPGGTSYRGRDFRNAYAPGVALAGTGQYVGLVELDSYYASDITTYETQTGLPNVTLTNVLLDGFSGAPSNNTNAVLEVSLDIEMVAAMAPGLSKLYIFEGNVTDHILGSMVTNSQIKQFSSSWGLSSDAKAETLFQQMAVQGQTFFQASGDGDAYTRPISWPSDDLYVTSVGGTSLTLDYTASNYVSETVWNSGFQSSGAWYGNGAYTNGATVGGYWGSGGGISTNPIPVWQQGVNMTAVGGSATQRNIPDVALTAVNIWVSYFNGLSSGNIEGTSCAAPLWAGFTALVNQQATVDGKPPVGFLNPALYAIGEGQIYNSCFHDIASGNDFWPGSPSVFSSAAGYDLCTGWGTPNGANMINALENFAGPIYVDFNYTGTIQDGSYNNPFKTLAGGITAVGTSGTIIIRTAGSSSETMTITKPLTLNAAGGPATVGH